LGHKDVERYNRARNRIDPIVTDFRSKSSSNQRSLARPHDARREILSELPINPSAGRFEGLLDASIVGKLASALLAEKP
jgi:hypothetical protein